MAQTNPAVLGPVESSVGRQAPETAAVKEQWILTVKRYSYDGGELVVRCPHCKAVIGVEGQDGDDIRGEQFLHRGRGCDGWLEVATDARRVDAV